MHIVNAYQSLIIFILFFSASLRRRPPSLANTSFSRLRSQCGVLSTLIPIIRTHTRSMHTYCTAINEIFQKSRTYMIHDSYVLLLYYVRNGGVYYGRKHTTGRWLREVKCNTAAVHCTSNKYTPTYWLYWLLLVMILIV